MADTSSTPDAPSSSGSKAASTTPTTAPAASAPASSAPSASTTPSAPTSAPAAPDAVASETKDDSVSTTHDGENKAGEQAQRGVQFDHGEPDPRVEAENEARLKATQDPWGTTPVQMRDTHDPAVDPAEVGIATRPDGTGLTDAPQGAPYNGIEPDAVGEKNEPQGTLPPV